jgi:uncharacterized protein (TIGR03435 family)
MGQLPRYHSQWYFCAAITLATCAAYAQTTTAAPDNADNATFAVAVVKPSAPDESRNIKFLPGGRFVARGATVRLLIKIAYNLNDDELDGGPSWIGLKRFDIEATPDTPDAATDSGRNHLRLQRLLTDRFQLKLRSEKKTMSTYALLVAKGGPKLKPAATPGAPSQFHGNNGTIFLTNATMDQFAAGMSDWVGHPVLNQTGLDGKYDIKLEWTPDQPQPPGSPGAAPPSATPSYDSGPTIFTALQQQLGLSLQSRKNEALCEVVESVELPAEN